MPSTIKEYSSNVEEDEQLKIVPRQQLEHDVDYR